MKFLDDVTSGRKTFMAGGALLAYLLVQLINKEPPDPTVTNSLLAAMGVFIRMGVAKTAGE